VCVGWWWPGWGGEWNANGFAIIVACTKCVVLSHMRMIQFEAQQQKPPPPPPPPQQQQQSSSSSGGGTHQRPLPPGAVGDTGANQPSRRLAEALRTRSRGCKAPPDPPTIGPWRRGLRRRGQLRAPRRRKPRKSRPFRVGPRRLRGAPSHFPKNAPPRAKRRNPARSSRRGAGGRVARAALFTAARRAAAR
jgi:hypothetical protein